MCGIIAVVRRQPTRPAVALGPLLDALEGVRPLLDPSAAGRRARLERAAGELEQVDRSLRGVPGLVSMVDDAAGVARIAAAAEDLAELAATVEAALDDPQQLLAPSELEATNAALIRGKDALWAIRRDRLRAAAEQGQTARPGLKDLVALQAAGKLLVGEVQRLLVADPGLLALPRPEPGVGHVGAGQGVRW